MSLLHAMARLLYGLYAWSVFLAISLATLVLVTFTPGVDRRRAIAHRAARAFLELAGMPLHIEGPPLPGEPCVVVANHASYLDGVILKAALPPQFCFVIKKEMVKVPLAGVLLKRIGSEFVDRSNRHTGGMDARRLIRSATGGQSLAFFPEGTFVAAAGVGRFHTGAFITAARAGLPVVPVAIRGARRALPAGAVLPMPGPIKVSLTDPLPVPANIDAGDAAVLLRDAARARIIALAGEADRGIQPH